MNIDQIHTLFLIIVLLVSLFYILSIDNDQLNEAKNQPNNQSNNQSQPNTNQFPQECPLLIDPETKQPKEITTPQGKELFQKYLLFYLQNYLDDTKDDWNYITPQQFRDEEEKDKYFILDVRRPTDYQKQHLPNSTNIFWLDLLTPKNLNRLPRDREILVVCYVGHTASQILVLLKLLGFRKTKVLKFGMGISPDPKVPIVGWTQINQ